MALAAGDAQMMYEEEREYEAIHGDPEAIHRLQSHTSRHPAGDLPPTADNASDLTVTLAPKKHAHHSESTETGIDYRYLEWSTRLQELSKFPEDLESLPAVVTQVVDPFLWGRAHKNIVLTLCCASTFVAAYTAGAYTSGINQMEAEWGIGRVPLLVGLTIYTTGFAMAPMMLAPLSEVYGRRSVFILSYALFNGMFHAAKCMTHH